jgi:hypothetical protein
MTNKYKTINTKAFLHNFNFLTFNTLPFVRFVVLDGQLKHYCTVNQHNGMESIKFKGY